MRTLKRLYGWLIVLFYGCTLLACTLPHAWVTLLISLVFGDGDAIRRQHIGRLHMLWGMFTWHFMRITTRMRVTVHHDHSSRFRRYIVIANHRTALDHPIVNYCAAVAGVRDLRWVQKALMRRVPVIGWLGELEGDAFLSRNQDPRDIARLKRTAGMAMCDNASVMIYPEGTRFRGVAEPDSPYRHVREPKLNGFRTLVEFMPDTPILCVTLDWGEFEGGRTLDAVDALFGRRVRVVMREFPPIRSYQAEAFLRARWEEHDSQIAGRRTPVGTPAIF